MLQQLDTWDRALFSLLNGWHSEALDPIMALVSEKWFWIPLYLYLLWQLNRRLGWRLTLGVLLMVGLTIVLSDQISASLLKPLVGRWRPCQPEAMLADVHIVDGHCGGKYGFVSSHAANFFALASFLSLVFRQRSWTFGLMTIAALNAYSRVYLGVHYPGDVLAGALLGAILGVSMWWLYQRFIAARFAQPAAPFPSADHDADS